MRTPRIALALYLLFTLAAAFPAMAGDPTVRYVANGGSNTTQCTAPENPCASIHHITRLTSMATRDSTTR